MLMPAHPILTVDHADSFVCKTGVKEQHDALKS